MDNLSSLRISSFEDDEEEDQEIVDAMAQGIDFEDDDDDDEDDREPVSLGFAEKPRNRWSLLRHYFPSKAGGIPAWLDPIELPSGKACLCDICGNPLQFLLQVYAPISGKESAFHRTLFVFMCRSKTCLLQDQHEQCRWLSEKVSRSVKVFRCQLPRANPFYLSDPPKHDGTDKPLGNGVTLCNWCGTWKGHKVCSSCRRAHYCSEKHQSLHWKSGHKVECRKMTIASQSNPDISRTASTEFINVASKTLWPELEIINEDESEYDIEVPETADFANLMVPKDRAAAAVDSVANFEGDDDKKSWATFQAIVAKAPEQILRYSRSVRAKALWHESSGRLSRTDIPKCNNCGGPRIFEFQILPQLFYYFGVKDDVDSLDWATIVLYTCEASCDATISYTEEFVWVQHSS